MTTLEGSVMREILQGAWWVMLLRGILAIILGLFAFLHPAGMIIGIVQVMGIFFIVDGVLLIIGAVTGHTGGSRWLALLGGVFYILAGIVIFGGPLVSTLVTELFVIYLMAFFALITGVTRLLTAFRLWKELSHRWLILVEGIISILFAVILIESPILSALVLMRVVGIIAVILAINMIILAFGLRKLAQAA